MNIVAGPLFAIPYLWDHGAPDKNERIIAHIIERPFWFTSGMDEDERWRNIVFMMLDRSLWKWEIWRGGEFVGLILLDRVVPRVDAVFHFTLFKGTPLVAARRLLRSFLAYAFEAFALERISTEVPEQNEKFARFLRSSLGFKYEGELNCRQDQLAEYLSSHKMKGLAGAASLSDAAIWLAKFGSRRERSYWDGTRYRDIYLLRLLKSELLTALPGDESWVARENGSQDLATQIQRSPIQAIRPA